MAGKGAIFVWQKKIWYQNVALGTSLFWTVSNKNRLNWLDDYVCVCVCVCVCSYSSTCWFLPASSGCTMSLTYVRSSDQRSFVVSILVSFCQVPSSLFLNLSYFTSKDENSSHRLLERKRYGIMFGTRRKDDIYWYRI